MPMGDNRPPKSCTCYSRPPTAASIYGRKRTCPVLAQASEQPDQSLATILFKGCERFFASHRATTCSAFKCLHF